MSRESSSYGVLHIEGRYTKYAVNGPIIISKTQNGVLI